MLRKVIVAACAVQFASAPVVATAAPANCPPEIVAYSSGVNPSYADTSALLDAAAAKWAVPRQVVKAVAYQEGYSTTFRRWSQFNDDGTVVISADGVCGVGIMQVTADGREDAVQLATDIAYNVDQGAKILSEKWTVSGSTDDKHVIENWYYVLCLYNGCGAQDDTIYAEPVSKLVHDPFRYGVPLELRTYMPPGGFSRPQDADPAYDFPAPFEARLPNEFVFSDHIGYAPTHDDRTVPRTYPAATSGPDGPGVRCTSGCVWWRLAEGVGLAGRAHWTNSVTSTESAVVTWAPALPRYGRYRVSTYVPAIGTDTLGMATYGLAGTTVTIDQNAKKSTWAALGDRTLSPGAVVRLGDLSTVAGQKLVADGVRFAVMPRLDLTASTGALTYGQSATITARLTHDGTSVGLGGRTVKLYRRRAGTTAWIGMGQWPTAADGRVTVSVRPGENTEYTARYVAPGADVVDAASGNRRVSVRPYVRAALSRTTMPRGGTASVSTSVAPNHAGQPIVLQRYYSGAWRNVLTARLSSASAATFTFRLTSPGTYSFRVYKPADADHILATTGTLTLRVT